MTEDIETALQKLKKGNAVGADGISAENLHHAHPCLIVILKLLFNSMLKYGFVPDDFGKSILIPLIKDSNADTSSCENYRGISLNCSISKVFEYVLLHKYSDCFKTHDLQFGFRNGVGCSDALHTVKSVINHFNKNGNTVTIAALDISKAFDRVSFYALLNKLILRKVPKEIIKVLYSWYTKNFMQIKWKNELSEWFQVEAGVRQGGVLSPFLFAIYIEDVLLELKNKRKGCVIGGTYLGCILYADDILLLSQSVTCLQSMLCICDDVGARLDLKFNVKRSSVLRIGKRFNVSCCNLLLNNIVLPFVEEIKYLGVTIKRGLNFSRSTCSTKIKFYRSFNAVYSKAFFAPEEVLVNLFKFYCLPIITYACEAIPPSKSELKVLDKLIYTAFCKNFHTFDKDVIELSKFYFGLSSCSELLGVRQHNFLNRYHNKGFVFSNTIACVNGVNLENL